MATFSQITTLLMYPADLLDIDMKRGDMVDNIRKCNACDPLIHWLTKLMCTVHMADTYQRIASFELFHLLRSISSFSFHLFFPNQNPAFF